jgi:hypothetical protein
LATVEAHDRAVRHDSEEHHAARLVFQQHGGQISPDAIRHAQRAVGFAMQRDTATERREGILAHVQSLPGLASQVLESHLPSIHHEIPTHAIIVVHYAERRSDFRRLHDHVFEGRGLQRAEASSGGDGQTRRRVEQREVPRSVARTSTRRAQSEHG